jgi:hypothetical protein
VATATLIRPTYLVIAGAALALVVGASTRAGGRGAPGHRSEGRAAVAGWARASAPASIQTRWPRPASGSRCWPGRR